MIGLYVLKYPYRKILEPLARSLRQVNPDILSYAATILTIGTAVCYYKAASAPRLLLWAIGLTLFRMTLNTLDGVMAIQQGKTTLAGEVVNALPDRYSDILLVGGVALSPLCGTGWGLAGMVSMLLVSYTGMLGKAVGVQWQHHGPLGKVERLVLLMVFSLIQYLRLRTGDPSLAILGVSLTPLEWCMMLYLVLGQLTVGRRLAGTLRQIRLLEWPKLAQGQLNGKRILVAYDSSTGNTKQVAAAIAEPLHADLQQVDDVAELEGYDLVVIGSPNIRGQVSARVARFLEKCGPIPRYATFVTYGMPIWGPISTGRCTAQMAAAVGHKPLAVFRCRGRHAKYGTYKVHPSRQDLENARLFGAGLALVVEKSP